jgi:hypothetical protein
MLRIAPLGLAAFLAACATSGTPDIADSDLDGSDTSVADTDSAPGPTDPTGTVTTPPGDYNGTIPSVALDAPEFLATNYDDTDRTQDDLMGQPTVMWFFPFSGTAG